MDCDVIILLICPLNTVMKGVNKRYEMKQRNRSILRPGVELLFADAAHPPFCRPGSNQDITFCHSPLQQPHNDVRGPSDMRPLRNVFFFNITCSHFIFIR